MNSCAVESSVYAASTCRGETSCGHIARSAASMGGLVSPAATIRTSNSAAPKLPAATTRTTSAPANTAASTGSTRRWPRRSRARPVNGAEAAVPIPNAPAAKPAVEYEPVTERTSTTMAVAAMPSGMRAMSAGTSSRTVPRRRSMWTYLVPSTSLSPPCDRPDTLRPARRAVHHTTGTAAGRWPGRW
jgi:hypothetical protein